MMAVLARSIMAVGAVSLTFLPAIAVGAEGGSAGMPQLDVSKYPTQLFWLAVSFVFLFAALRLLALPRIGAALEARREKIDDDLAKAAVSREEAEAAMAAYEKALADAAAQAQAIQRETAQEISRQATELRTALAGRLAEETKAAEARITAAKEPAIASLQDVAVEVVQDVASKLAGLEVSKADAEAAVEAAFKEATQ